MTESKDWRALNRANWDERVGHHLVSPAYDLTPLREGRARLHPIEEQELGDVTGLRVLHLQCHFGRDSLILVQKGACEVVALDFSGEAITAANRITAELGYQDRARFVEADLYDAPTAIPEPASFDRVVVTWGAIYWLPDIRRWAEIAASFLKPGGALYLAEGHPSAFVFDSRVSASGPVPGPLVPYFQTEPFVEEDPSDYANAEAVLVNAGTYSWPHQLGQIVTAIIDAGLTLRFLHEHDSLPWAMYDSLRADENGMYRWPDKPWLPLAFSLLAERR